MLCDKPDFNTRNIIERRMAYGATGAMRLHTEGETRPETPRLVGYAAVFDKPSADLGGFTEFIQRGAFKRTLEEGADVRALVDHDSSRIIGRRSAGTLELEEDRIGLRVLIHVADTTAGRDVLESVRRGDLKEMSFAFSIPDTGLCERWEQDGAIYKRTLIDVDLHDVSIVSFPAYADSSIALARAERALRVKTPDELDMDRRRYELAKRQLAALRPVPEYMKQMERDLED